MSKSLQFMIIGAQKAGTTALAHFLSQHPAIAMAKGKEVHLFDAPDYMPGLTVSEIDSRYAPHFAHSSSAQLCGEATPIYLYSAAILPELKRYNPSLKLIVLLRDPIARAISHYEMEKGRGNESLPLLLALLKEKSRLRAEGCQLGVAHRCHSYAARGDYAVQLERLRKLFDDRQILILESEELKENHYDTLSKAWKFLGVPDTKDVAPERVFSGSYSDKAFSITRVLAVGFLRWRFRESNRALKAVLQDMQVHANWHWL